MKKLLLLAFIVAVLAGCSTSPQKRAEKLIAEYVKKTANAPRSYDPVGFGVIDTVYDASGEAKALHIIHEFRINNAYGQLELQLFLYTIGITTNVWYVEDALNYNSPEYKAMQGHVKGLLNE